MCLLTFGRALFWFNNERMSCLTSVCTREMFFSNVGCFKGNGSRSVNAKVARGGEGEET